MHQWRVVSSRAARSGVGEIAVALHEAEATVQVAVSQEVAGIRAVLAQEESVSVPAGLGNAIQSDYRGEENDENQSC